MTNELILQYQQKPSKELEDQLLDLHKGYIRANVNKWSGILPQPVLETYGKNYAINAFKSFDPNKGGNINTHLYNHISQLSRMIYQHQNTSIIPEHQVQLLGKLNQSKAYLTDVLGHEPSVQDLSDHLSLPVDHIERIIKNNRADLINDSDTEFQTSQTSDTKIADRIFSVRNSLKEKEKEQFDALTGFGGIKPLSPQDFGKKFKMKPYEVSRLKTSFAKRFK